MSRLRTIDLLMDKRRFIVLNGHNKSGVIICEDVSWADLGLQERQPGTPVHLRTGANDAHLDPCEMCGHMGGIWVENVSTHEMHVDRCRG
jgi:hypothetical protein